MAWGGSPTRYREWWSGELLASERHYAEVNGAKFCANSLPTLSAAIGVTFVGDFMLYQPPQQGS